MESRYTWKNQVLMGLRNFAVLAGIILLLTYLVVVSGKAARQELEEMFVQEKSEVTVIDEPVAYGYEDGAKIWELRSELAEEEKQTESSELSRIYELILFKGGEENVLIGGDHGLWDKPREKLTLTGNVQVESADGTTLLETEKLIWEEKTKTLACPEFVDFLVEENHVLANSLYSDDDLATIDFVGEVRMFVVGLEGANFVTREGDFPIEDIEGEPTGKGMNVLAEYVHYDKGDRLCKCYPFIPVRITNKYHLDEEGRPLPPPQIPTVEQINSQLEDPEYVTGLEERVSGLDLTDEERAFLAGETDTLGSPAPLGAPGETSPVGPSGLLRPEDMISALTGPGENPEGFGMSMGLTSPSGESTPATGAAGAIEPPPDVSGPVTKPPPEPMELPRLPTSDPEKVLSSPDYSLISDWRISENLGAELYEGGPGFDPDAEERSGMVFCYRENKKFWCEELFIDLDEHRLEALRRVDGRFSNLKDENREPPESRAGKAVQESPTQIIGNYLTHNWRENVTQGYGRVLAIQAEKDIEADNVIYYEDQDAVHAWGDVVVHQYGGRWWATSGAIEDVEDERAKEDVQKPTTMTADAVLSYNKRVTWGYGNLVYRQEEQTITGDRCQYEDGTRILVVAGNVEYENVDGERLSCALLTMDLYMDEYIAEGAAIARNIVPEEYKENLAEFRRDEDRQPEDDARTRLLEKRTAEGLGDWSEAIEFPPSLPPIEVLPDKEGRVEPLPPLVDVLGPEVPSPTDGETETTEDEAPPVIETSGAETSGDGDQSAADSPGDEEGSSDTSETGEENEENQ